MPGPAPKPADQVRRRNAPLANTLQLPAGGRRDPAPAWPLRGEPATATERELWAELWATPQAVAWERLGWTRVVARYVQTLLYAEQLEPIVSKEGEIVGHRYNVALLGEVRQLEDRLGLTPTAMLRLRWEVTGDELAPKREERKSRSSVVLQMLKDE